MKICEIIHKIDYAKLRREIEDDPADEKKLFKKVVMALTKSLHAPFKQVTRIAGMAADLETQIANKHDITVHEPHRTAENTVLNINIKSYRSSLEEHREIVHQLIRDILDAGIPATGSVGSKKVSDIYVVVKRKPKES